VNRLCGSGIEAIASGSRAVKSGEIDICITGGSESMSRAPFILPRAEQGYQRSQEIYDSRLGWRSVNPRWRQQYGAKSLIECAEETARRYGVSREEQDEYAARSHQLAAAAWDSGRYADSVIPVSTKSGTLDRDETIRPRSTTATLGGLGPLLGPGTSVTAGNASPMNDGAAAVLLASRAAVQQYGLTPKARVVGTVAVGVHPDGLDGPVPATRQLLEKVGWDLGSLDAVEMTEAYASQVVACVRELKLNLDIVNTWGGAIAIGHPLGASGARLVSTLVNRLIAVGGGRGVATMCIGVGQGISMAVETC
jgi:acetyl-CoA acyltransferase